MSTNLTAEELRTQLGLPVVQIKITGFEILHALAKAREITNEVALFSYGAINRDIENAKSLLKLDVQQFSYHSPAQAETHMRRFGTHGPNVVIGSGAIIEVARKIGLRGIFVHGMASIRQAMEDAVEISRLMRSDAAKRERLNAIVHHLKEGVLAVEGSVLTVQDGSSVQRADRNIRAQARHREFKAKYRLDQVVGSSPAITLAKQKPQHYANSDSTVLITGESGAGKELFAQGIHNASARRDQAFVTINCPAVPGTLLESELFGYEEGSFTNARRCGKIGLFETAHTGTLLLDEIGDTPIALQARLLRVLQEREILRVGGQSPIPIDVRVIAATNCDLRANIANGTFRKDLYYRLNILHLDLPTLWQRKEDVTELAASIAASVLRRTHSTLLLDDFLPLLIPLFERYSWPGNVREMENVIERAIAIFGAMPGIDDLNVVRGVLAELSQEDIAAPHSQAGDIALPARLQDVEGAIAREMVGACCGDLTLAAKRLGISRTTLWRKLNRGHTGIRADE